MSDVVIRCGPISAAVPRRMLIGLGCMAVLVVVVGAFGLCYASSWISPGAVWQGVRGLGPEAVVVHDWRLPRVEAALVFGAALGVSGALLQNVTRNPLGSPDIIGLGAGAYTGALMALTFVPGSAAAIAGSSVLGGLGAAGIIVALSVRSGLGGLRLIVVGIAVNATLTALNGWIVLRMDDETAVAATGWSAGSLNGVGWEDIGIPFAVLAVAFVALVPLSRSIGQTGLGDDLAVATGVRLTPVRLAMIGLAVVTTATVTAVAGSIAFVALAAPQIGRRIVGATDAALLPAALVGAVLLAGADILAQALLSPESLPVGAVTTSIGGCYLIWLLIAEVRRATR